MVSGQRAEVLRVCLVKRKIGSLPSVVRYEVLIDIVLDERKRWRFNMSQWTRYVIHPGSGTLVASYIVWRSPDPLTCLHFVDDVIGRQEEGLGYARLLATRSSFVSTGVE